MIPLRPIHHTTLPQPSQKWPANHFTIVWLMCRLFEAGHHLQEPVTWGGQAGSEMAAPEVATLYKHNATNKNTEIPDLHSVVDHLPHRCLIRWSVHGLATTGLQSSRFLTPAYLKAPFHKVSWVSNIIDVQADQDRYTKTPKSHQVK